MIKNYGFDESKVVFGPEDYVFGGFSKIPNEIKREDGQWETPVYEPQAEKYETQGCTIWGMENQAEMFIKSVYGYEPNYDERFTYLHCNVGEQGTNPQNAYTSAREDGLIDNEPLPDTFAEFKDTSHLTSKRIKAGQDWRLKKYEFMHEWVRDTSKQNIVNLLKYSPIAIGVTAWQQDEDGLYVDGGRPNTHWCVVYGHLTEYKGKTGIFLKVFDSYDHSEKILHPDHWISVAKRIYVRERSPDESIETSVFETLFENGLLDFFLSWLEAFKTKVRGIFDPGSLGAQRSSKWRQVRAEHLRKNPWCAVCGSTETLEVHHIEMFSKNPARELDPTNLVTLCESGKKGVVCHRFFGHLGDYKKENPQVLEDAKAWSVKLRV